jgi:hypothetical protein
MSKVNNLSLEAAMLPTMCIRTGAFACVILLNQNDVCLSDEPSADMAKSGAVMNLQGLQSVLNQFEARLSEIPQQLALPNTSAKEVRDLENARNEVLAELTMAIYGDKAIYGIDDRKNYDHPLVTDAQRRGADATAALVLARRLEPIAGADAFSLPSANIIDVTTERGLCTPELAKQHNEPEEPFFDEANPAFCSVLRLVTI